MGNTLEAFFGAGLWAVIKAVLILVLALIVSAIVKSAVTKLLAKTKLGRAGEGQEAGRALEMIGKLVHLIVFLLFVPGIFESLGLNNVSAPILGLLNTIWGYLPNILAAGLILWIGFYIAKLVRELLAPALNKLEVNRLQKMAGMEVTEAGKLSNTLAYLVYVLILIPVIITALQALKIKAISDPAVEMLTIIFDFLPYLLAAIIIFVVGWMIAKLLGAIVERVIAATGVDAKLQSAVGQSENKWVFSSIVGKTLRSVLVIFFVVEGINALHMEVLTQIGAAVIGYLPYVLAAAILFIGCWAASTLSKKALLKGDHKTAALVAQCAIYTIGAFFILSQLGIAKELVDAAFILILAALAVAFAISFGIGGKDFAGRALQKLEEKCQTEASKETHKE